MHLILPNSQRLRPSSVGMKRLFHLLQHRAHCHAECAITPSGDNPPKCYPCCWTLLLPMIPAAQPRGLKSAREVAKTAKVFALGRQYPAGELDRDSDLARPHSGDQRE